MANFRTVAMIALLTALGSEASIAISPQDVPGEVKACKAISNDKERLKCFDNLFGGTATPEKSEEGKPADWTIEESKSPADGSPQVVAANLMNDTVLILRCRDRTTEAAFSTQYNYLGYKSVDVQLRIKGVWKASIKAVPHLPLTLSHSVSHCRIMADCR